MKEKNEPTVEVDEEKPDEDVVASKRRLIGQSRYVIPGILALSVADLANAQIDLGSPPGLPNP